LMRAFRETDPAIELALVVGNRLAVLDALRGHKVDVAIAGRPPRDDRIKAEPLHGNQIACITAPDDPAAAAGPVPVATLGDRPWLLREPGSGTRTLGEQFLVERGLEPETLTLGSNGAIKQAVIAGLGVSLLSRAAVAAELDLGLLAEIPLTDGPAVRPWFMLHSAIGPVRGPVESFLAFVRDGLET
jgi:LysR family transcriptional regulator, low CO2-responsive transcriptional regulator